MQRAYTPEWAMIPNFQFQTSQSQYLPQYYSVQSAFPVGFQVKTLANQCQQKPSEACHQAQFGLVKHQPRISSSQPKKSPSTDKIYPMIRRKGTPKFNAMHIKFLNSNKPAKDQFHPKYKVELPLKFYDQSKAPLLTEQAKQQFQKANYQQYSQVRQERSQQEKEAYQIQALGEKEQANDILENYRGRFSQDKKVHESKNKPISKEQISKRTAMHTRQFLKKVARFQAKGKRNVVKIEAEQKNQSEIGLMHNNYQLSKEQVKLQPGAQLTQNRQTYQQLRFQQPYRTREYQNFLSYNWPFFSNFPNRFSPSYPFFSFLNQNEFTCNNQLDMKRSNEEQKKKCQEQRGDSFVAQN